MERPKSIEGLVKVDATHDSSRLSDFVFFAHDGLATANSARKAVKRGRIKLNGQICKDTGKRVHTGDAIELIPAVAIAPADKVEIETKVIFEDEDFAAVIKPAGIETRGHRIRTLEHALFYKLSPWNYSNSPQEPAPSLPLLSAPTAVHRLDYETTGLVLIAKSERALPALSSLFQERLVHKTYLAIVQGETLEEGELTSSVDGLECFCSYRCLEKVRSLQNEWVSLLELKPTTGRRHQLRRQLSDLGHPIVGDSKYSEPGNLLRGKGLFLAATGLKFFHPFQKEEVEFEIEPPPKFRSLLERERRRWSKFHNE